MNLGIRTNVQSFSNSTQSHHATAVSHCIMADKSWDEKMRDFDAGKPICEVHQDPNPSMRFSLFGDECDDPEQQSSPSPRKAKKKGEYRIRSSTT